MLSSDDRKILIAFLNEHADGDVLVQAANRVSNNLNDVQELKKYISKLPKTAPPAAVDRGNAVDPPPMSAVFDPEDLGPPCKKLGANGQAIQKVMEKDRDTDWSVDGLATKLKIPKGKIKPMLALLLEREIILRATRSTYQIK